MLKNLKFIVIGCYLFSAASAMDTLFSYTSQEGIHQKFSSSGAWVEDLQKFLNNEEKITTYIGYKKKCKDKYRDEQIRQWECYRENVATQFMCFSIGGGAFGLWSGLIFASGPLLESTDPKVQQLTGIFVSGCGLVGALGGYGFRKLLSWWDKAPVFQECPQSILQQELENKIHQELFTKNYLTLKGIYPVEQGKTLVNNFIKLVMERNS